MTDTIHAWSQVTNDNDDADALINWLEGQPTSTVNNSSRAMMKRVADFIAAHAPKRSSTGTGNAYVVDSPAAGAALRDGESITFLPDRANTAACTLNVAARGAKPWRPAVGVEFVANNILTNVPVTAYYRLASDEWISVGTGYYVTALASGVALQSITARLPQIGDLVVSYAPSPGPGRIRLGDATQAVLKSAYPELNSYLSSIGYPWGSNATTFNLPPAGDYFLRFAKTGRAAGSTEAEQYKETTIPATGLTASSSSSTTTTITGGTIGGAGTLSFGAGGVNSTPTIANTIVATSSTTTTTTLSGSATLAGGTELRVKNVAFHLDVIASTALAAAQVAVFGLPYRWDVGTADADPGAGRVRGNNATLASITTLYVSNTDGWGVDLSAFLTGIVNGNLLWVSKVGAQANRLIVKAVGSPIAATGYYKIPVTVTSAAGTFAANDQMAIELGGGASGPAGATGPTGATGPNTGLDYAFTTGTSGDPGSGNVGYNSGTIGSVTQIRISKTGRNGESLSGFIATWDDASNATARGHIRIFTVADRTKFIELSVTGALTDNTTYWTVPVSVAASGTLHANTDILAVMFERSGNDGSGIPVGGVAGQILRKQSSTNFDVAWGPGSAPTPPQGRLTLSSNTAVMTATVTGATTVYYTPYVGRFVPTYNGTTWVMSDAGGELSQLTTDTTKSPAAVAANAIYDILVWDDAGTMRATRSPAWASDTSRGTGAGTAEIERVNGIWVNRFAITNGPAAQRGTYVGTIRSNASSQIDFHLGALGTAASIGVWNAYNHAQIFPLCADDAASWTYNSSTWRAANATTKARISFVRGLDLHMVQATYQVLASGGGTGDVQTGINLDSTTASPAGIMPYLSAGGSIATIAAMYLGMPGLGWHFLQAMERQFTTSTAATFISNGTGGRAGMTAALTY